MLRGSELQFQDPVDPADLNLADPEDPRTSRTLFLERFLN
jgi:hypothetical protein